MLQSVMRLQVLDCEDNPTYVNGWVGSIYKQSAPLVNAFTKTNEWQVYDIYWKAPRFGTNDELESPAMITVVLNGIVVQNNYVLKGTTPYTGLPKYVAHGRLPLSYRIMEWKWLSVIYGFVIYKLYNLKIMIYDYT